MTPFGLQEWKTGKQLGTGRTKKPLITNPPAIKSFTKTDTILKIQKHRRSKLLGLTKKTSLAAGILIYLLDCSSIYKRKKK
jgi:hypothetical protein